MYLMPTFRKWSNTFVGRPNAGFHIARKVGDEIRPLCGSDNVTGPATALDRDQLWNTCRTCQRLMPDAQLPQTCASKEQP